MEGGGWEGLGKAVRGSAGVIGGNEPTLHRPLVRRPCSLALPQDLTEATCWIVLPASESIVTAVPRRSLKFKSVITASRRSLRSNDVYCSVLIFACLAMCDFG